MTAAQGFAPHTDSFAFRNALGRFPTGVTVVTCASSAGPVGITANSFASVSLDPPLILWSPARTSSRFGIFAVATHFAVHVLKADQAHLCARFTRGGAGFEGLAHHLDPDGVPLIEDTLARFECETHARFDGGDHEIIVGRVRHVALAEGDPLLFSGGRFGHFQPQG